jgi:ABC-type nitrate/sulfonate/bicarbonate transport system substrate-binding protein
VAEELPQDEGFTDVRYVPGTAQRAGEDLASGEVHLSLVFTTLLIVNVDAGDPIVALAAGHAGCLSLMASPEVRSVHDLKGKTLAVARRGDSRHLVIAAMLAHVGLDPPRVSNRDPR